MVILSSDHTVFHTITIRDHTITIQDHTITNLDHTILLSIHTIAKGFTHMNIFKRSKKNTGNKMNMTIAKTHRLSARLVGMQLTLGNLIGIVLSMCQMSLGFIFLTAGITKGNPGLIGMIALVGCALALLIERLSIGGLSSVRETGEELKVIQDDFYRKAERREPTPWQVENKDRLVKEKTRKIHNGWRFAAGGMFLSTLIGDMFWEWVFSSMPMWQQIPMSLACACVIGITFVHSELFKSDLDKVIKAILRDLGIMKAATSVEEQNMQLDMMVSAMGTVREDEERRVPIEDKIAKVVVKRLSGFADHFSELTLDDETKVVEAGQSPQLQIAAPRRRTQYEMHKDELISLLSSNPGMSLQELADHFGKPKASVQNWVDKLKVGV
jgi:hypothetical protein